MTSHSSSSSALVLIDPLNDFIAEGGKLWLYSRQVAEDIQLLPHLRALQAAARDAGLPVFFVPHRRFEAGDFKGFKFMNPTHAGMQALRPFERGSWGGDFHDDFQPRLDLGDVVVLEHWLHNGFANTDLDFQLKIHGIDRLLIAGMRGNTCVEATARAAVELGYHVTLVKDASAAFSAQEWRATFEVNAPAFAHAIVTTSEAVEGLGRGRGGSRPV
jgi:nicotinamidase-related amidase